MAEEAHKEPTMEEILASIRKIISEDDGPSDATAVQTSEDSESEPAFAANDEDEFDTLSLEDALEADPEPDMETEDIFDEVDLGAAGDTSFEPAGDAVEAYEPDPAEASFVQEPQSEVLIEPDPADFIATEPAAPPPVDRPAPVERDETMSSLRAAGPDTLTEDSTADAAAGALAKLVARMDMGSENTLEGLVSELLKPMLKEWLDQNLPAIVEEKVEAEVQRIARMAR